MMKDDDRLESNGRNGPGFAETDGRARVYGCPGGHRCGGQSSHEGCERLFCGGKEIEFLVRGFFGAGDG